MGENKLFGTDGAWPIASDGGDRGESGPRRGLCAQGAQGRQTSARGDRQGYAPQRLHAGKRSGSQPLLHGWRRATVGTLPTPGIAVLVRDQKADAGCVFPPRTIRFRIMASSCSRLMATSCPTRKKPPLKTCWLVASCTKCCRRLAASTIVPGGRRPRALHGFCVRTFPADMDLKGLRLVLIAAMAPPTRTAPAVFKRLGASVTTCTTRPTG